MENYLSLSVFCSELSWWRTVLGYQVFVVVVVFCSELSWWRIVLAYQFRLFVLFCLVLLLLLLLFSVCFVSSVFRFCFVFVCLFVFCSEMSVGELSWIISFSVLFCFFHS